MKQKMTAALALAVALGAPALCAAAPASEASVKELMAVTHARGLVDGMGQHMEALTRNAIQQQLNGKTPSAKQQQAIDNMTKKLNAMMQSEMAWEKLEPMYLRTYENSFSQEEVAGMLAFYKTPAGQAVINKMPVMMQQLMGEMQQKMAAAMPQLQRIQQEFVAEMKAAGN